MSIKYTVIIPVFNAQETIARCLNSLLNHIPKEAELILVDDGSDDESNAICRKFAEEYCCIHLYSKKNGGVSSARNYGLHYASGEYILFVDSDDYVSEQYWDTIVNAVDMTQPDMLQYGFAEYGKEITKRTYEKYVAVGKTQVAQKALREIRNYMFSSLCCRLFKRSIIVDHNLLFEESIRIGEDQLFIFKYTMHVTKLVSTNQIIYNVVLDNQNSLSRKKRDYLVEQLMDVCAKMRSCLDTSPVPNNVHDIYTKSIAWVFYRSAYSCCKELTKFDLSPRDRRRQIREICRTYRRQRVKPMDIKCLIIAIPILFSLANAIDRMIRQRT